jgi:predicted ester cyclase
MFNYRGSTALVTAAALLALVLSAFVGAGAQSAEHLIRPTMLLADNTLSKSALESLTLAPRRYDTFWHTGDERLAKAALSPAFIDRTLPKGRMQGPEGPLMASKTFRSAVPDLTCEVEQMLIAGDRVTAFLHFRGHFTGTFDGRAGQGQTVDFIAVDIYRVQNGLIIEDWHLEDNLTLMQQLGMVAF